ncbi:MAG TPA: DUF6308 family protein [Chthonomonadaceae bacterium]|nr:DUF6308 family protein [Chthonomonadaceae bacterium]
MSFRSIILSNFANVASVQDAIDRYFYREVVTGSKFELVADNREPYKFTAQDIVAVSMLGVNIPAPVSLWLLYGEGSRETSELLRQVPTDR